MIERLCTLFALVVLTGCSSITTKLPIANLAASDKTVLEDLRPAAESTREIFSLVISNERYGTFRLPQTATDPSGPRLFAHRLQEKYGSAPVPAAKLHHFVMYINDRAELRSVVVAGAIAGALGAVIVNQSIKREGEAVHTVVNPAAFAALSGDDEYKRAHYGAAELPAGTSVYVVYIESEIGQKRRFTRTLWPAKRPEPGGMLPLHEAIEAAIKFNLAP